MVWIDCQESNASARPGETRRATNHDCLSQLAEAAPVSASQAVSADPPVVVQIDDGLMELLCRSRSRSRSRSAISRRRSRSRSRNRSRSRTRSLSRSCSRWPSVWLRRSLEAERGEVDAEPCLEVSFSSAIEEIAMFNLPIHGFLSECPKDSIMSLVRGLSCMEYFYIGATVDPLRRWLGDNCGSVAPLDPLRRWLGCNGGGASRPQATARERAMPGHCLRWTAMYLIGIASNGVGSNVARALETELIQFAMTRWPSSCTNVSPDARGQRSGINFMYMVTR